MGIDIWAGLECTINRVGAQYFDQCIYNGHEHRPDDLHLFCDLGIRALRYPALWERAQPAPGGPFDWKWPDDRLGILRGRAVRPIVGLIHHGSGPRYTSLLDDGFAEGLANYAGALARRYPWLDAYTPVNEPLTTARFSALYGHWYPHCSDDRSFVKALLNQCRAVVLAMRAIREINPEAELIQTDDVGKTYSTKQLKYQADFDNERRWITWDLLCGGVNRSHPLWNFLHASAIEQDILWFQDNPCPPDIIGVNYYVTSERFLDHRLDRYPVHMHGGNCKHRYADVEAVRVLANGIRGAGCVLREAWERFRRPLAVTEVHLGCTPREQVRWLVEVLADATQAMNSGADVRAVTAWSLLGAFDWHCLLTRPDGQYEPGVFDVRGGRPRATILALALKSLARGEQPAAGWLQSPGWWRRDERLLYAPVDYSGRDCAPTLASAEMSLQ